MRKLVLLGLVAGVIGGVYFVRHYEIRGLDSLALVPRGATATAPNPAAPAPPPVSRLARLRLATMRLGLDEERMRSAANTAMIVRVLSSFDLVAVQDIRLPTATLFGELMTQVNAKGRHYQYALSPQAEREPTGRYLAVVFNEDAIEIDRTTVGDVDDPLRRFAVPPLVATFRAKGPPPQEAFTFILVNAQVDTDRADAQRDALADVFRSVRDSGLGEDDVLLLADTGGDDRRYGRLAEVANMGAVLAIDGDATATAGLSGNLFFDRLATIEYTGRGGVFDCMREFKLSIQEAAAAVDQLPIWGEFTAREGGGG